MSWLGAVVCALAAWRLRATPLFGAAAVTAAVNVIVSIVVAVLRARRGSAPRATTALTHVSAALGAFFLFVSFAL